MSNSKPFLLRARWVFPVEQDPLHDGVVEILAGKITALRAYRPGEAVKDLGDVALLPGLVNAHTHLEFSQIKKPLGTTRMGFPDWIREVIAYRQQCALEQEPLLFKQQAISQGLAESQSAGVALLGEIATENCPTELFQQSDVNAILFAELLGLAPERQAELWNRAEQHLALANFATCRWQGALSPHAPYTVNPELLSRVCNFSQQAKFPVAMHLAESLEEIEFLLSGSGRMVEFLDSMRALPRGIIARGTRPQFYLELLAQAERALVIHGNYLADDEIAWLGERSEKMSVVYCPRTHAYFNAGDYPLAKMLAANVNVCLGTDSRASNPDLNLFEEMRFVAQRHPAVSPEGVLYLGTQAGAEALGRGAEFGTLSPGKDGRLAVVQLKELTADDPHELLFAAGTSVHSLSLP